MDSQAVEALVFLGASLFIIGGVFALIVIYLRYCAPGTAQLPFTRLTGVKLYPMGHRDKRFGPPRANPAETDQQRP